MPDEVTNPNTPSQRVRDGGQYIPTIWVDPDGCEHWVMDDGEEGFMTPHVNRHGIPVCREPNACGSLSADQYFATDKFDISPQRREALIAFFNANPARGYIITGHTDSRASDAYNITLSLNRANAVARVAAAAGANVIDIRGFGERQPIASNATVEGRAQNRRVDILCVR
ncbi:MAG: OmpA family protein [Pseudomonadota bacterium]